MVRLYNHRVARPGLEPRPRVPSHPLHCFFPSRQEPGLLKKKSACSVASTEQTLLKNIPHGPPKTGSEGRHTVVGKASARIWAEVCLGHNLCAYGTPSSLDLSFLTCQRQALRVPAFEIHICSHKFKELSGANS